MFDFSTINFADKLFGILIAIMQALIISLLTGMVLNRSFKQEREMGKSLRNYDITRIKSERKGTLSPQDYDIVFGLHGTPAPMQLSLSFLTGFGFFRDFECKAKYLSSLISRGCQIRILVANPHKGHFAEMPYDYFTTNQALEERVNYYYDIFTGKKQEQCFAERSYSMLIYDKIKCYLDASQWLEGQAKINNDQQLRNKLKELLSIDGQHNGDHIYQLRFLEQLVKEIRKNADNGGTIQIRFYEDEYQMPIILCKCSSGDKQTINLWTNINAPIRETMSSINVAGQYSSVSDKSESFVKDTEATFEYMWKKYKSTEKIDTAA